MRPIHKVAAKTCINQALNYICVRNGKAYATDTHAGIIIPVKEVFGENIIDAEEELYFDPILWASCKMDKANEITRDGLLFTAISDKQKILGTIKAITSAEFINSIGKYPDVDSVFPTSETAPKLITWIGINYKIFNNVCSVIDADPKEIRCTFYGITRGIIIRSVNTSAVAILMPCVSKEELEKEGK